MGKKLAFIKERRRQKRRLSLRKRVQESYNMTITEYITKIDVKIHSIILTGYFSYNQIVDKIGEFNFDYKYLHSKSKKKWGIKYNATREDFNIVILTEPLKDGPPTTMIKITPHDGVSVKKHKAFLSNISDLFPNHNLSSVEFAVDLFCPDEAWAGNLFEVLKRNVLIPNQRCKPRIYPKSITTSKKRNHSVSIGKTRIYERGNDKNKKYRGWDREDMDRVRIEHTSKGRELKKNKLNNLSDLLRSAKFVDINQNKCKFKKFKVVRSKKIPGELDDYSFDGSFQGEYFTAREKITDRNKRVANSSGFRWFAERLLDAMKDYDLKWGRL